MRKRVRKKLRFGEYQEFGFTVQFRYEKGLTQDDQIDRLLLLLHEAVEQNGLCAGGGGGENYELFVTCEKDRHSTTDKQRNSVAEWLSRSDFVVGWRISEFRDAWHG